MEEDSIILRARSVARFDTFFRVRRHTKLGKLMSAYCAKWSLQKDEVVFRFQAAELGAETTAEELGMQDNDVITVYTDIARSGARRAQTQVEKALIGSANQGRGRCGQSRS